MLPSISILYMPKYRMYGMSYKLDSILRLNLGSEVGALSNSKVVHTQNDSEKSAYAEQERAYA